jgi:hypothetical protein
MICCNSIDSAFAATHLLKYIDKFVPEGITICLNTSTLRGPLWLQF